MNTIIYFFLSEGIFFLLISEKMHNNKNKPNLLINRKLFSLNQIICVIFFFLLYLIKGKFRKGKWKKENDKITANPATIQTWIHWEACSSTLVAWDDRNTCQVHLIQLWYLYCKCAPKSDDRGSSHNGHPLRWCYWEHFSSFRWVPLPTTWPYPPGQFPSGQQTFRLGNRRGWRSLGWPKNKIYVHVEV